MTTRRTTMTTRAGAARSRRAQAAVMPQNSAAEPCVTSEEFEKSLLRARKGALKLARRAQEQTTAASKVIRRSMKEAVAALKVATNKAALKVAAATAPEKPMKATRRHAAG
jgi:uncharacterized protein YcaQ